MTIKPRIYDLARVLTSSEPDEKVRKIKQSDITKQIVSICDALGYPEKSSASSIDEGLLGKIIESLHKEGVNVSLENLISELKEQKPEKKTKTTKATKTTKTSVTPPPVEPPVQKKQLKIVRRIKPAAVVTEEEKPSEEPSNLTSQTIKDLNSPKQETISQPIPKKETPSQTPTPQKFANPQHKSKEQDQRINKTEERTPQIIQPFRVARPTMIPSMMGRSKRPQQRSGTQTKEREKKEELILTITKPTIVVLTTAVTVKELSEKLSLRETEVIKALFSKGVIRTVNQTVEFEVAVECAKSLGYEVVTEAEEKENILQPDISQEEESTLEPRPPVVTIMGHVDHGKTSLLDAIRETKFKLIDQESGGITQHIGAYQVEILDYDGNKRKITFLDTPGHEAFTALRARGAQVTDIAVLVVAADDGVMPQTIEAIDHAKAAGVPIIVAVNKIDKEGAQIDRIMGQLADHNLLAEDYGGKTVFSKISAKKRLNLDDLLTKITLVADAELTAKLRANPQRNAQGAIVEAQLTKEKGVLAHLLVQNGTLKKGDCLVAGNVAGRVRAMFDDHGREIEEAPPSFPVEIIGLPDVPRAGDTFEVCKTYQEAKELAAKNKEKEQGKHNKFHGLIDFASQVRAGQAHELKVIIKADVQGSAEAVSNELVKLSTNEVLVRPIHVGSGDISENDVNLAASTDSIIIGFHVAINGNAQKTAEEEGIDVRLYEIIYKITEDLEKAVLGLLEPEKEEVKLGSAEVRQIFTFGKGNKIAGSYVLQGKIQRNQIAKVIRNDKVVFEGKIDNLKRFKDDAKEVLEGFECGISFDKFQDVIEKDIIECWTIIEKERTSLN